MAEIAFRTIRETPAAEIALIQDGVILDPDEFLDNPDIPIYAVERDLSVRGVTPPEGVESVSYEELLDKIIEQEVKSFV